jgi:hypothetical protein
MQANFTPIGGRIANLAFIIDRGIAAAASLIKLISIGGIGGSVPGNAAKKRIIRLQPSECMLAAFGFRRTSPLSYGARLNMTNEPRVTLLRGKLWKVD